MADVIQLGHGGRDDSPFRQFAERIVAKNDARLFNYGPDEQTEMILRAMRRLNRIAPLTPVTDTVIDLAGFGTAPLLYVAGGPAEPVEYLLLSDVVDALGWSMPRAHKLVQEMAALDLEDQRREDEERGDGRLGWRLMRAYIRLDIELIVDDPDAKPDADGKRWSDYSEWLVSRDRLPFLISASPWGREFYENTKDAFGLAMRKFLPGLKAVPTYGRDGEPTGSSAYDMFPTDLTEEEALRKARRGPSAYDADS